MKVVLVNYHYFINGGPDRYFFNILRLLQERGHTVIPFCFNYTETRDTPYRKYFPMPITGEGPCLYNQQHLSLGAKLKTMCRLFVNPEANRHFRTLLQNEKPDLIYMIYLSSSFLPYLIHIAKAEFGIPVLYRISDFHMFCPSYLFCRQGRVCTECRQNLWASVKYRCVKNSRGMSALRALQIKLFRMLGYYRLVDLFISPAAFTRRIMIANGIDQDKIVHLPTFADGPGAESPCTPGSNGQYMLYSGNISREKGIESLICAYARAKTSLSLVLAGKYEDGYKKHLESMIPEHKIPFVHFRGFLNDDELKKTLAGARFVIHPALWYENIPNSLLEAMSLGKAVLATDIGSLPELVQDGINGLLVPPGDIHALADGIDKLGTMDIARMGQQSREIFFRSFTHDRHLERLEDIFATVCKRKD